MKINFVSFLDPYRFHGGGELDNRMLLNEGNKYGYNIKRFHRVKNKYVHRVFAPTPYLHKNPDLWILSDVFNVPEYKLAYPRKFLENIIENEPFIHLDNAYVDICSRGPLPCSGDRKRCKSGCGNKLAYDLYAKSQLNIFLSPLHANTVTAYFNQEFKDKTFVLRPLVDPARFYNACGERDIDYIYVGTISNYKGYQNLKERFSKEKNFLFVGKNATGEKLFGRHIEYINNESLIHYLNRAKNFVHLPLWKEPMGRTVVEAALCGCNIIANENVGARSFDFDISDPQNCKNSAGEFWEKIKTLLITKSRVYA